MIIGKSAKKLTIRMENRMIFTKLLYNLAVHHDVLGKFKMTHFIQGLFVHIEGTTSHEVIVEYPIFYSEKNNIYLPGRVSPMGNHYDKAPENIINRLNQFETGEIGKKIMGNSVEHRLIPVIDSNYNIESYFRGFNLLVGKAGVGKSHLIRSFYENYSKSIVKVAPTALAAINIGGTTIHSFFNLPLRVIDVENDNNIITINKKYSSFDDLIIDEISMVPGYIIDAIDKILRANNDPNCLFGGKNVFAFGDLLQLEPIPSNDRDAQNFIDDNYSSSYWFFDAKALEDNPPDDSVYFKIYPTIIEYSKRHTDKSFIKFLDIVRKGKVLETDEELFYEKCSIINQNPEKDNTTYLTTRNDTARAINNEHIEKLLGKISHYESRVSGEWSHSFPNNEKISLKVGAEIIFIKNDYNKKFINGEKGKIKELGIQDIVVEKDDGSTIVVGYSVWKKIKYEYNTKTKTLDSVVVGTFSQLPIKLGWAITIHKSQGMTLNHISLFLNDTMFAKGMLYVTLSRVRNISDIFIKQGKMDSSLLQTPDQRMTDFMKWMGILNA
jgi:hypothetical protein